MDCKKREKSVHIVNIKILKIEDQEKRRQTYDISHKETERVDK